MMRYLIILIVFCSCKKLVDVAPPTTSIVSETVFSTDASASAAVTGIYSRMITSGVTTGGFAAGSTSSMTFFGALSADELVNYNFSPTSPTLGFYGNAISSKNTSGFWSEVYQYIYTANAGIEGLSDSSTGVSSAVRTQLMGECKFVRAFCYFYLTNLFGDVPLITSTDYLKNQHAARTAASAVYDQIIADLLDASRLLSSDYSTVQGGERVRPIRWAAVAMLARTYLYLGRWADAETQASLVINSGLFSLPNDLTTVFLKNSRETIWALRPDVPNQNTPDAITFILTGMPSSAVSNVSLHSRFLAAFEPGDQRQSTWVNSITVSGSTYYFPYKYRVTNNATLKEYSMVLRLAEQYLVRAEARAEQNNLAGAADDVNLVRARAGLGATTAGTQPAMLSSILHERQTELFTEWGHRWLDLKRTHSIDGVMSVVTPQKGGTWVTTAQLWPIPLSEIQADPSLIQNPGYTN